MSGWAAKQAKKAEWAEARKLDGLDNKESTVNDTRDAAMGKGEDQLFEKKLSKEEQKAEKERKKAQRCVELTQPVIFGPNSDSTSEGYTRPSMESNTSLRPRHTQN